MAEKDQKLNILVADDSYPNRMMLYNVFKDEFNVILADNGAAAIVAMEEAVSIAVAIVDLYMPERDGFAVLERFLGDKRFAGIPVLAMTTAEDITGQTRALDLGVAGILTKPLNMQIVTHKLHNVLIRSVDSRPSDRQELFSHMYKQAELDEKTGIYNRVTFCREARKLIDSDRNTRFVIFRWDLDGFKVLNDVYGIDAGDRFLQQVGEMYIRMSTGRMVYGRWEADHFVTCMPYDTFVKVDFVDHISHFEGFNSLPFNILARLGVYIVDDPSLDVSLMCDRALLALRSIKGNYTRRVAYYDDSMREELLDTQQLIYEMEDALANNQFTVYLQPQYNYSNNRLHGAEALVRWIHPERGIIPPAKFIPIFEKNGFITKLDMFVWETVARHQRKWMDAGLDPVPISVNVSRTDIFSVRLSEYFTELVARYRLPASAIRIEITESAYMDNPGQLIEAVERLQMAGFSVEMDDFGSGYSSLNSLKDVPVDLLKLDMKFISKGSNEQRGGSILSSVVRMTNWLKLPVLAEGVETKDQADYLKSIGCIYMQGYYFARPMPISDYEKILTDDAHDIIWKDSYESNFENAAEFLDTSNQATLLFNSFVGGAAIIEYDGERLEAIRINDKFFDIIGVSREQFRQRGLDIMADFDEDNRTELRNALDRAIDTGNESDCKLVSYNTIPGKALWTHARMRMLAVNAGKYLFYLAVENITEQMELLMSKKKLADQLSAIVNHVPGGIINYEISQDMVRMVYFNEDLPGLFGYTSEEYDKLFGTNPYRALYIDDVRVMEEAVADLISGEKRNVTRNLRHLCKDGTCKSVYFSGCVTRRTDDTLYATVILINTEERTKAQQKAENNQREVDRQRLLLQAIYESMRCGVIQFSSSIAGYRLQSYNEMAWRLLGFKTEQDFIDATHQEFGFRLGIVEEDRERVENFISEIMSGPDGSSGTIVHRVRVCCGDVKTLRNTIKKVVYNNELVYVQYVFTEVTEQELPEIH